MVERFEVSAGPLAQRLLSALQAAEEAGGDFRGRRSAAIMVIRPSTTGRPWHDMAVDLRVDDSTDPVAALAELLVTRARYQDVVRAFQQAIDGDPVTADRELELLRPMDANTEPDQLMWRAVVAALAGREEAAREMLRELSSCAPQFLEAARRFGKAGLMPADVIERIVPTASTRPYDPGKCSATSRRGARQAHASPASSVSAPGSSRVEPAQHGGVPVEVRGREVDAGILGDQRRLRALVGHAGAQDRPGRRGVAELGQVLRPQRALPHEQLVRTRHCRRPSRESPRRLGQGRQTRATSSQVAMVLRHVSRGGRRAAPAGAPRRPPRPGRSRRAWPGCSRRGRWPSSG